MRSLRIGSIFDSQTDAWLRGVSHEQHLSDLMQARHNAEHLAPILSSMFSKIRFTPNNDPLFSTPLLRKELEVDLEKLTLEVDYHGPTNEVFVKVKNVNSGIILADFNNLALQLTQNGRVVGYEAPFDFFPDSRGLHSRISCPRKAIYGLKIVAM